ncbi:hypothetical protein GE061_004931 [Apolygus lucorum]|uniref:Uncharacterized protein n=1 Tax=Apolygus lucorum TaxID=248454 RepID=A0A8S9WWJ9_APOLU|nr:hypothetical protein GE061_004931 [Apolygus lucorum]
MIENDLMSEFDLMPKEEEIGGDDERVIKEEVMTDEDLDPIKEHTKIENEEEAVREDKIVKKEMMVDIEEVIKEEVLTDEDLGHSIIEEMLIENEEGAGEEEQIIKEEIMAKNEELIKEEVVTDVDLGYTIKEDSMIENEKGAVEEDVTINEEMVNRNESVHKFSTSPSVNATVVVLQRYDVSGNSTKDEILKSSEREKQLSDDYGVGQSNDTKSSKKRRRLEKPFACDHCDYRAVSTNQGASNDKELVRTYYFTFTRSRMFTSDGHPSRQEV